MEEHAVTARLNHSRDRIRAMLIRDAKTGRIESQTFPRSALMRVAFDARARRLLVTGLGVLLLFKGRRTVGKRGIVVPLVARALGRMLTRR